MIALWWCWYHVSWYQLNDTTLHKHTHTQLGIVGWNLVPLSKDSLTQFEKYKSNCFVRIDHQSWSKYQVNRGWQKSLCPDPHSWITCGRQSQKQGGLCWEELGLNLFLTFPSVNQLSTWLAATSGIRVNNHRCLDLPPFWIASTNVAPSNVWQSCHGR